MRRMLFVAIVAGVVVPRQTLSIDPSTEVVRYHRWELLERARMEDYNISLGQLYRYGAILFLEEVERHRREIAEDRYTANGRMAEILQMAGILQPHSTVEKAVPTEAFRAFAEETGVELPERLTEWRYSHWRLVYAYIRRYFHSEWGAEGLSKAWAKQFKAYIERTLGCRELACLPYLHRLVSTYPSPVGGEEPSSVPRDTTMGEVVDSLITPPKEESGAAEKAGVERREESAEEEPELPSLPPAEEEGGGRIEGTYSFPQKGLRQEDGGGVITAPELVEGTVVDDEREMADTGTVQPTPQQEEQDVVEQQERQEVGDVKSEEKDAKGAAEQRDVEQKEATKEEGNAGESEGEQEESGGLPSL